MLSSRPHRWMLVPLVCAALGGAGWQAWASPKQPGARSAPARATSSSARRPHKTEPAAKLAAPDVGSETPEPWPRRKAHEPVQRVSDVIEPWSKPPVLAAIGDEALADPWARLSAAPAKVLVAPAPNGGAKGSDALIDPWAGRGATTGQPGQAAYTAVGWSSDHELVDPWRKQPVLRSSGMVDLVDPWSRQVVASKPDRPTPAAAKPARRPKR